MPKFVKWVPTRLEFMHAFFELAPVASSDIIYDLGSGDGRLLVAALEKGAGKCIGIDIDLELVNSSREMAKDKGLDSQLTFIEGDVMAENLSSATIILCYLLHGASAVLRPKFENELKAGTRVVMESFPVPGWKPTKTKEIDGKIFYLYVMPPEKTDDYEANITDTAFEFDWWYWP